METTNQLFSTIANLSDEWVLRQVLRGICYSTKNDQNFQLGKAADYVAEAKEVIESIGGKTDKDGRTNMEVPDSQLQKLMELCARAEAQAAVFGELHVQACAAYKEVAGEEYRPATKSKPTKAETAALNAWKKRIAG